MLKGSLLSVALMLSSRSRQIGDPLRVNVKASNPEKAFVLNKTRRLSKWEYKWYTCRNEDT